MQMRPFFEFQAGMLLRYHSAHASQGSHGAAALVVLDLLTAMMRQAMCLLYRNHMHAWSPTIFD